MAIYLSDPALGDRPSAVAADVEHTCELGEMEREGRNARLFLAPGVMHRGGGPEPDAFDSALGGIPTPPSQKLQNNLFSALIAWTGAWRAPAAVVATKFDAGIPKKVQFQRQLCPYPAVTGYTGRGDPKAAKSFTCGARLA